MTYTVWDIETSIRSSYKRKANPFDPENFVVMSGWRRKGGPVVGEYFGRAGSQAGTGLPDDWFIKLLDATAVLVGQNIKFDLLYALQDAANHKAWMAWVAKGGIVWDTQLAEYLLNGMMQSEHMLSMDELAPRYGGNVKFDEVKVLWNSGVSTEDIDPGLLRRYLCGNGDEEGDIGNTEIIFLGQLDRARACGQVKSIMLNMGSLLATVEMELNGMAVDRETGLVLAKQLELEVAEVSLALASHLPDDLPFDFNWNSAAQKSAIIFGGKVKYPKRVPILDEEGNQAYTQMDATHAILEDGTTLDENWWFHLHATEWGGEAPEGKERVTYKGGKNKGEVKYKKVKVNDPSKPKSRWEDFYYTFPRITDPKPGWAGSTEGQWSTSADVIAELGNRDIPFLENLSKVVSLSKDLTTYYIVTDPETGESKGMLTLVQADGIIHHMLNHTSTVTGRFSSSNPNLQNLPKEGKSKVKSLFVSRFPDGKIIQSDFSSLEVYVQAILTRCKQLIEDLKAGLDMHCVRVSQKEHIDYEEAVERCKNPNNEHFKEWNVKRTKAKIFSFQRAYGAGAPKISESAKIPLEEVEALIAAEAERYPEIDKFYEGLTAAIKANSKPTSRFAQHPEIPGLSCNFRTSTWRTPDNKLYSWTEHPSPAYVAKRKGGSATSFTPTEIKNYPVQGAGGEWAKAAMWLAVKAYYMMENWKGAALLVNQVHDALYSDAKEAVALEAAACLHACMEEASTFMEYYFDWPLPLPVPSDTNWGVSMMDEGQLPDNFKERVAVWRQSVRKHFIDGYTPSYEKG